MPSRVGRTWYSQVAPVSWLVSRDVNQGRRELNFSEWEGYEAGRKAIFKIHLADKPVAGDIDIDRLAAKTSEYTGADIANAVSEAVMLAIRELIGKAGAKELKDKEIKGYKLEARHLEAALEKVKPKKALDLQKYKAFKDEFAYH